ncbi:hypothetical protein T03_12534 [Trichinella britovi]|uniref:Uncharacterized protein n=1 Tax=Trichinella britovi TaxID=45882 RepID=A0A0V1DCR6_TRIBR|nr:hypothetical protein T03_7143 [Trichinella britovi]KRY59319.1 hypothetical protein T03_12534 [Trichinella britovi]
MHLLTLVTEELELATSRLDGKSGILVVQAKCVETLQLLKVTVTYWVDTSSMFRLNDVVIDRNDVHPTLSISVWSKMPFMSSSGDVFSSSPSHLVPSHHTMFARSVCNV